MSWSSNWSRSGPSPTQDPQSVTAWSLRRPHGPWPTTRQPDDGIGHPPPLPRPVFSSSFDGDTDLPLPRAQRLTERCSPYASPAALTRRFEWDGMRAQKRF